MIPESVARFRIVRKLGAGGMGEVYLADDPGLNRLVALKVLAEASTRDDTARQRLIREAQAAARLEHPNVCTIYEVGEDQGHVYFAMQIHRGRDAGAPDRQRAHRHRRDAAHRVGRGRRAVGSARPRHHPPRHQAAEHHAVGQGRGEGAGLRARQGRRRGSSRRSRNGRRAYRAGNDPWHNSLHVPRAAERGATRSALRHLQRRLRAVRDGERAPRVCQAQRGGHDCRDPVWPAAGPGRTGRIRGAAAYRRPLSRDGQGPPLRVGAGPARRSSRPQEWLDARGVAFGPASGASPRAPRRVRCRGRGRGDGRRRRLAVVDARSGARIGGFDPGAGDSAVYDRGAGCAARGRRDLRRPGQHPVAAAAAEGKVDNDRLHQRRRGRAEGRARSRRRRGRHRPRGPAGRDARRAGAAAQRSRRHARVGQALQPARLGHLRGPGRDRP